MHSQPQKQSKTNPTKQAKTSTVKTKELKKTLEDRKTAPSVHASAEILF